MRVLLFAPNAGLSFSTGGGAGVGLRIAEVLNEAGHEVHLAGYHALPLAELDAMHGTNLAQASSPVYLHRADRYDRAFPVYRGLPFKLSAYSGLLTPSVGRWLNRTIDQSRPDLLLFQDDIPSALRRAVRDRATLLYVHYPFAGLRVDLIPPLRSVVTRVEWANDRLLAAIGDRLLLSDPAESARAVLTNSTITAHVVEAVWASARPICCPPYVRSRPPGGSHGRAEQRVLAVGAIQPAKNYATLIDAFAQVKAPSARLTIAGHARDSAHARSLRQQISARGMDGRAEILQDIARPELERLYDRSAVQVHPAVFEPFGVALLEGMSAGCAAISSRSNYAGGWVDLLDHGRFGQGFSGTAELTQALEELLGDEAARNRWADLARGQAATFSRERFRNTLLREVS